MSTSMVSMPHAALWVVQHDAVVVDGLYLRVSMPHAALWVVQRRSSSPPRSQVQRFNAARGFVGGAAQ